ncbi:MAG TPA: hypothetical protein VN622_08960 [Clostridia bacterium]|nr:hypothetical protein [Clostridia bacterium]
MSMKPLAELLHKGARMSNLLYNIAQLKDLPQQLRDDARRLQLEWDAAKTTWLNDKQAKRTTACRKKA